MNAYDRVRLAALVDGDGGRIEVHTERNIYLMPYLVVRCGSPEMLEKMSKYGGEGSSVNKGKNVGKYLWRCKNGEAIQLAGWIRPMMWDPSKQQQAELLTNMKIRDDGKWLLEDNQHIIEEMLKLKPNSRPPGG